MNIFKQTKESITTRQAAEMYGVKISRNNMASCPFHNDRTPSMKVDKRFHCFGCGADGDVIDLCQGFTVSVVWKRHKRQLQTLEYLMIQSQR